MDCFHILLFFIIYHSINCFLSIVYLKLTDKIFYYIQGPDILPMILFQDRTA
ncbi:hypothetical protein JCM10003_397 [Bacteroides pyogenes JCM 10003]|nr:hypothetical protein JCM10003_397 [Bacteroides pyogenes JCM 10003]